MKNLQDTKNSQPEQDPVAWIVHDRIAPDRLTFVEVKESLQTEVTPLYTTPPQRTWVGLTTDEMLQCNLDEKGIMVSREQAKRNVEAKLKEKNT